MPASLCKGSDPSHTRFFRFLVGAAVALAAFPAVAAAKTPPLSAELLLDRLADSGARLDPLPG